MEKAYYYKASGERIGPLPAGGAWPSVYAARGLTLLPPAEPWAPAAEAVETEDELDSMSMAALRERANALGVRHIGQPREAVIASIRGAKETASTVA